MDVAHVSLLIASLALTGAHCVSAAVAGWRHRRSRPKPAGAVPASITIVRPLKGVDATTERCLESSFQLSWNDVEVIFCVASADDPVVPLVQRLMGRHPAVASRLLVGNDLVSDNPKLNNMIKAWPGARGDWIVFVDANVDLPCDAVERILAVDAPHVGLISSPPRAMAPSGADALIECAILNSYQGRWQSFADAIGYGFAQGKFSPSSAMCLSGRVVSKVSVGSRPKMLPRRGSSGRWGYMSVWSIAFSISLSVNVL